MSVVPGMRYSGPHATDSTALRPWPCSVLPPGSYQSSDLLCYLSTIYVSHQNASFMEKGTSFVIVSNIPCFLPKARTVPGNIVGIQEVSVGKYMITSLRRCKIHKSLAKVTFFKRVSFFHPASIFSPFSILKLLPPSMVGSGLQTSSSPPIQTQQISTSTSSSEG